MTLPRHETMRECSSRSIRGAVELLTTSYGEVWLHVGR